MPEVEKGGDSHVPLADLPATQNGSGSHRDVSSAEVQAAERELRAVMEQLERSGEMSPELQRLLGEFH